MTNKKDGVLYIGVTNNIARRVFQHKNGEGSEFCQKYGIDKLVYCEETADVSSAIEREKQMKKWKRQWKVNLIEESNPDWEDLSMT